MVEEDEEQTSWHVNTKSANAPYNCLKDSLLLATSGNSLANISRTKTSSPSAIYYVIKCSIYN